MIKSQTQAIIKSGCVEEQCWPDAKHECDPQTGHTINWLIKQQKLDDIGQFWTNVICPFLMWLFCLAVTCLPFMKSCITISMLSALGLLMSFWQKDNVYHNRIDNLNNIWSALLLNVASGHKVIENKPNWM